MTKLNQESGRSMVEMLGVLAIIGVLSIGGIAGYTMAMNRYRANEILDAASKVAIIAQTLNAGNGGRADLGDADYPERVQGLEIVSDRNGCITMEGTISDGVVTALDNVTGTTGLFATTGTTGYNPGTRETCIPVADPS